MHGLLQPHRRRSFTRFGWGLLLVFGPGSPVFAAMEPVSIRSQSGQFVVHGLPVGVTSYRSPAEGVEYLRLDPTLTAVSLERIRQALLATFGLPEKWRGIIHVRTHPAEADREPVRVTSVHYADGWGYGVDLPERLEKRRFFAVAVQVMLLEVANRTAVTHEAELPPWLAVGLAAELMATTLPTLALEPGAEVLQRERNPEPLRAVREALRRRSALKFDEIALPTEEQFEGEAGLHYEACSHLLVHELLRLRGGREAMREMLVRLPANLNWQTTFLQAYHAHFQRLIDVDKWYALTVVNLTGRDAMSVLSAESTGRQLDEILVVPVQVRLNPNELPITSTTTFQRIIGEWDFARQRPVLAEKVARLQALRLRAAPDWIELIDGYLNVMGAHLGGGEGRGRHGSTRQTASPFRINNSAVLKQLDGLDARRQALRERSPAPGPLH